MGIERTRRLANAAFAPQRNLMIATQVFYEGRVQGVGFRYSVRQLANGYEVTGWVRNLSDGRVELLAKGESDEVSGFLAAIAESELRGFIKATHAHNVPLATLDRVTGFEIRS